jgi:hypothetical protein
MYIAVRGWLDTDGEQRGQVRDVIERYRGHACYHGWIFPESTGWTYCIFYGTSLREGGEVELRELVAEIARLPSPTTSTTTGRPGSSCCATNAGGRGCGWSTRAGSRTSHLRSPCTRW